MSDTATVAVTPATKPLWKTTEFWFAAASYLAPHIQTIVQGLPDNPVNNAIGAVLGLGVFWLRTHTKTTQIKADATVLAAAAAPAPVMIAPPTAILGGQRATDPKPNPRVVSNFGRAVNAAEAVAEALVPANTTAGKVLNGVEEIVAPSE